MMRLPSDESGQMTTMKQFSETSVVQQDQVGSRVRFSRVESELTASLTRPQYGTSLSPELAPIRLISVLPFTHYSTRSSQDRHKIVKNGELL